MLSYTVNNRLNPPRLEDMRLGGAIERQMETFFRQRVRSDFAKKVIYQETEDAFRQRLDDQNAVGMWRGEFWGKWIISACRVARYEHDDELKQFIRQAARNLLSTADADGYVGTYRDPSNYFSPSPEAAIAVVGHPSKWNWNIWCRKYTLWGLLESYELTGDPDILAGAVKATDQLLDLLEKNHTELSATGTFNGLPSGSILKPMLILYRHTENPRYLDFAKSIAANWNRADGKIPNLIANSGSGKPIHTWYPEPETWTKAYEMMSCLDGIIELYRVTGDEACLRAVENMYRLLKEYELNPLFGVGFNDLFLNAKEYINSCTEPCDVIHWMRVCSELYKLTGKPEYMSSVEYAFYNPFLAASFADGNWGARAVRSCGRHLVATLQSGMEHSHCCVNNMPRGYLNAMECFAMLGEDGLRVNLFTDFACSFGDVKLTVGGTYLTDGKVRLEIDAPKTLNVWIRVPEWSEKTEIGGETFACPGEYVRREVNAGHSVLELRFDLSPRLRKFHKEPKKLPFESIYHRRFVTGNDIPSEIMTWDRRSVALYGPLLLTRSKLAGNTEEEMFASAPVGDAEIAKIEPLPSDQVRNLFRVTLKNGRELTLCDFATGSNRWSQDDPKLFNIYL